MKENEQLVRIVLNTVGSSLLGAGVINGAEGQQVIGALSVLISVGWWYIRQQQAKRNQ